MIRKILLLSLPAKAGNPVSLEKRAQFIGLAVTADWTPACAGMTTENAEETR